MHILFAALISLLMLFPASPAAADTIPQFSPDRYVYIDPDLASRLTVTPANLEAELTAKLRHFQGAEYYLVGLSTNATTRQIGVDAANSIIKNWRLSPELPLHNRVLIVWAVSSVDGHNGIGINVSPDIVLDRSSLNIKQILHTYLPLHPDKALLAVVTSIDRSLSQNAFMPLLVLPLVALIFSITLIKLMIDFRQFRRFGSIFVDLSKRVLAPLRLPKQSKLLVNAFRAGLLQAAVEAQAVDPDCLIDFNARLTPNHPRWLKLATDSTDLQQQVALAQWYLELADKYLADRDHVATIAMFSQSSFRDWSSVTGGDSTRIAPAQICNRIRELTISINQGLNLYQSYNSVWPEDRPVVTTVEAVSLPVSPPTEWPAQSPVYVAGNITPPSPGCLSQPTKVVYQPTHRINRSGSTRISSGLSEGYRIDDYTPTFGSDDKPDSFGSDDNNNDSFGSDD